MKDNTKVLKSVLDEQDKADDVELLLIVHMLPDTLTFLEQTGDVFNIDHILCIPYAVDDESLEQAAASFDVTVPSDIDDLRDRAKRYIQDFPEQHDTDLIVLEIGGYCADFINDIDTGHIRAIVEDTNNGHWAYEQADPDVPVLSIAQSSIKQLENRVVGPA
ncbi:MAG: hypothetical protein SVU32_04455, partial [Candidatus Nanohaloarchaea archaeon]|nr:hypothetical protein [Candidatus Nanohaloarchaea archaeon]